jgi:two-component system response regulator YesN
MYNILLTDDEQIVIDSLSFIINKNFEGQVNLYTANSGTKALEIATNEDIDIIFMDINMPGLSGLDTVSCINKLKPDIVIVILSAFDRFQYAQEAVSLGAFKYLTKPVNRNTVIDTVREAMSAVDKKRGQLSNEVELHKKLDLVSPMVESDFIYSAAFGGDNDVSDYFSYFEIEDCVWCFCCLEIPNAESKKLLEIYTKIRSILTPKTHCIIGSFMMNRIAIFFYFPSKMYKNGDSSVISENIKSFVSPGFRLTSSACMFPANPVAQQNSATRNTVILCFIVLLLFYR